MIKTSVFLTPTANTPRVVSPKDSVVAMPISQVQARQRAARAGHTGSGKCHRLYAEAAYWNEMLPNSIPDIQRMNLASTILQLRAMTF